MKLVEHLPKFSTCQNSDKPYYVKVYSVMKFHVRFYSSIRDSYDLKPPDHMHSTGAIRHEFQTND